MAKHPTEPYNAPDDEVRPGETLEDYYDRLDAEEAEAEEQSPQGRRRVKAIAPPKLDEFTDPNMGSL